MFNWDVHHAAQANDSKNQSIGALASKNRALAHSKNKAVPNANVETQNSRSLPHLIQNFEEGWQIRGHA